MHKFILKRFLVLILLVSCFGCTKYSFHNYNGWGLSEDFRETNSDFRNYRSGHLLVKQDSSVITANIRKKSFWHTVMGVTDTTRCFKIKIEIPPFTKESLPLKIVNPKGYLQICSCTWGHCEEEPLKEGEVEISNVSENGITASIDLIFPSLSVSKNASFQNDTPEWTMRHDIESMPKDVKKTWDALQME